MSIAHRYTNETMSLRANLIGCTNAHDDIKVIVHKFIKAYAIKKIKLLIIRVIIIVF